MCGAQAASQVMFYAYGPVSFSTLISQAIRGESAFPGARRAKRFARETD